ncbi:rhomboid family intramembrane serine protease [Beijerinckia indica]|uniref:Rhomboid family protein n=1 Tax=Beijerinckia indica subsp. indica (strain ATCC 9039 / DSM 1715 / NCIMB 8712) TaxID=395963 RepID=B2II04_BEII9|nr:rhomboid family intramembrane serine protease [Beijerinckia indica]ACB94587.1 Rhomboid family protein [Beijerinckia indica subsp. indica ATCC 9039]
MPAKREKIFNIPPVILTLLVVLFAIQALCDWLSPEQFLRLLQNFSFVPGRFTFQIDPDRVTDVLNALAREDELKMQAALFFLNNGEPHYWTVLTYAFLHGGWAHVGMNGLWFGAFGSAVARRFGSGRFLLFCAGGAIAGAFMHFLTHMADLQPIVGASAVVSAAMAAAIRFVFQPGAPLGGTLGFSDVEGDDLYRQPALPLRDVFSDRQALTFLAFWFLSNFLFGVMPGSLGLTDATIAWEAHIGGFLFGLIAFRWFDPSAKIVH